MKIAVIQGTPKGKIKLNNEMKCVVLLYCCSSVVDSLRDANLSSRPSLNGCMEIMKTSRIFSTLQKQWNVRSSILLFPQGFPFFSTSCSFTRGYTPAKQHLTRWHRPRYQIPAEFRDCAINEELPLNSKIAWKLKVEEKMDKWPSSISAGTLS